MSKITDSESVGSDRARVAMVTGAGSGIGRASAIALSDDGFAVVLAGRRAALLEETAKLAAERGGQTLVQACDVSDPDAVDDLFAATEARFGRLDFLFNNAGRMPGPVPLEQMSAAEWSATMDANLNGVFFCMQRAFALMKRQDPSGGRILNNGSVAAHSPRPGSVAYTASKHAVSGLTRQGALEGREDRICVGQIDIGNAATSMVPNPAEGTMAVDNVCRAVSYIASLPLEANVLFMTVHATTMPFVGRG